MPVLRERQLIVRGAYKLIGIQTTRSYLTLLKRGPMKQLRFEIIFATILVAIFVAFYLWQTPGSLWGKLRPDEVDHYLGAIEEQLVFPAAEKTQVLARLRGWAQADDGGPICMLNLMRYYPELRAFPDAPAFAGTPKEANAFYERSVLPILVKHGGFPVIGGESTGKNPVESPRITEDWSRVAIVRYPSRRSFLEFLSDPAYGPLEPFKIMAVEFALVPVSADIMLPDTRFLVGVCLLCLFLSVGWIRAARRHTSA